MITKAMALASKVGDVFYSTVYKNKDGTPRRYRVSGQCKCWVTRPGSFHVPVKAGMYEHDYVDETRAHTFCISEAAVILER